MRAIFDHAEQESPNIHSFYFKTDKPVRYEAGQFIELTISHDNPDHRGTRRWYTLSSAPNDNLLAVTTRIVADSSSFKTALGQLQKGDAVTISEPMGDFVLPKDLNTPLVFVAIGIGVTPFHSIVKQLHATGEQREIRFLYAVKNEDDIIFQDTFSEAGVHATIIVESPTEAWGGERGVLSGDHVLKIADPDTNSLLFLAGPEKRVERVQNQLIALDFPRERIIVDYFPGYTTP